MEIAIKPCPFCGGDAKEQASSIPDPPVHHTIVFIKCTSCGAKGGGNYNYGKYTSSDLLFAISVWNKRV